MLETAGAGVRLCRGGRRKMREIITDKWGLMVLRKERMRSKALK